MAMPAAAEPSTMLLERVGASHHLSVDEHTLRRSLLDGTRPVTSHERRDRDVAAHMLLHVDDPARVLELGTDHLVHELGTARADAGLVDRRDEKYLPTVVIAETADDRESIATTPLPNHHPVLKAVWASPGAVSFDQVVGNPALGSLETVFSNLGMTAMLAAPIRHDGCPLGIICLDETDGTRRYRPADHERVDGFVQRQLAPVLHAALRRHAGRRTTLTSAEAAAVRLLAQGHSYGAIARQLAKSPRTIDNQLRSARRKADVRNAVELVRWWERR